MIPEEESMTTRTSHARTQTLGMEVGVIPRRGPVAALAALLLATILALGGSFAAAPPVLGATGTYQNPILPESPVGPVESCADPVVIQGQEGETDPETGEALWFMYCTTDPLNGDDRDENGNLVFHLIPMFSSTNLVDWTYEGDAFAERPDWVGDTAGMWAPEIAYFDDQYYLYYAAQFTDAGASAIGVATSDDPLGPWTDAGTWVVEPDGRWTFDPEVVTADGERYLFYGSYFGGIRARELSDDGLTTEPETQVQITIDNRYEGAEVVFHDGFYYLFVSAANCCNGPLTGYGVFVGRSEDPLGPYVDQEGVSLLDMNVGGTPVIYQNGNRWVGPGHNTVFQDEDGQWWTMYHAVDASDPFFEGATGFTKRPAMLDAIDWVDGWPVLDGGAGPSDTPQQAPAAQEGETSNHQVRPAQEDRLGKLVWSDEFDDGTLSPDWDWVREPNATEADGYLTMEIQDRELYQEFNTASVLLRDLPDGNWVVETRLRFNVPDDPECCYNYAQAGLVVYDSDDAFVKAVEFANWNTRQIEFAKEIDDAPDGYQRYGNMVGGPVGDEWTYIRIVHRETTRGSIAGPYGGDERYTLYTSTDGETWIRGGTWAHDLGEDAAIGLIAMGLQAPADYTADFDYVRVYRLRR